MPWQASPHLPYMSWIRIQSRISPYGSVSRSGSDFSNRAHCLGPGRWRWRGPLSPWPTWWPCPQPSPTLSSTATSTRYTLHVLKVIDFPRYTRNVGWKTRYYFGIFRAVSRFPLNCGNFDYFLDSVV